MKDQISHLSYRDIPLSRCKDTIFYGDVSKNHIVKIDVLSYKDVNGLNIPAKLNVQLVSTSAASRGNIYGSIKCSEKSSLYSSLDLGYAWLQRSL